MAKKKAGSSSEEGGGRRFGIGEWFGRSFIRLTPLERQELAEYALIKSPEVTCPPRSSCGSFSKEAVPGKNWNCAKQGGVCSIREYRQVGLRVEPVGTLRTTCPYRFLEDGRIFRWIGEIILGTNEPLVVREIEFLEAIGDAHDTKEIGYIDNVLVHPNRLPLDWCALEIQAVYFSGAKMSPEFSILRNDLSRLPFPAGNRHPDYRSSGPKRLMPQLQIKVPSLRRWGKKMAVVVDAEFFASLGAMDNVSDISNCDIAWFVVRYDESEGEAVLREDVCRFTTLERAVEGLTGGTPVSLKRFEERIGRRIRRVFPERAATLGFGQ